MKEVVIVTDHLGLTERVRALKAAHPRVYSVTPWNKPNKHSVSVRPPDNWLPEDAAMSYSRKCHFKADSMNLAAVKTLGLDADFYWFIESDVVASQARWKSLFADHAENRADCVTHALRERKATEKLNCWWSHPHTPEWVSCYFIMACYRLSAAAVKAGMESAVEMRNCFSEVTVGSVVRRAGLTTAWVNERQTHWNVQTYKTHEERVKLNPGLVNHPVKVNTYDVPVVG
jgi:hypothetical protein